MNTYLCDNCKEDFQDYPSRAKRRKNNFCSKRCHDEFRRTEIIKTCEVCKSTWKPLNSRDPSYRRKTCSSECLHKLNENTLFKKGQIPHNYQGYKKSSQGYILLQDSSHPNANKDGYVKRANIVMEEKIGRFLTSEEVVHHIDENKLNDSPENLMLFSSNSEHIKFHYNSGNSFSKLNSKRILHRELKSKDKTS